MTILSRKISQTVLLGSFGCLGKCFFSMCCFWVKWVVVETPTSALRMLQRRPPTTWVSFDLGFAVGGAYKATWFGVGAGMGAACSVAAGCALYAYVGVLGTVNLPTISPVAWIWEVLRFVCMPGGWRIVKNLGVLVFMEDNFPVESFFSLGEA